MYKPFTEPAVPEDSVVRAVVYDEDVAREVAARLLQRSVWFAVLPLPDGEYEVATRNEVPLGELVSDVRRRLYG